MNWRPVAAAILLLTACNPDQRGAAGEMTAPSAAPMSAPVAKPSRPMTWRPLTKPGGAAESVTPRAGALEHQVGRRAASLGEADSRRVRLKAQLSNTYLLKPSAGRIQIEVALEAADATSQVRLPMNVALVIDRSGSMRGEKIEQTRQAARHLISKLTGDDTLAIVSYADDVRVDMPAAPATASAREAARQAIARIRPGGSTNLSGGLFRAQDEVQRHLKTGQVNRVILLSDGLANRGITDTKALSQQAQKHAQEGISVTTMGVGTDYNEDLMTAVADHASGNYYFIAQAGQIASVFGRELSRMFATVAQAVSVEYLVEDGVELEQIFGYTYTRNGDTVSIPLAEMFGGQKRSILLEVSVPVGTETRVRVGEVTLRYTDVTPPADGGAGVALSTVTQALHVLVTQDKALIDQGRNRAVEERAAEVRAAQTMTLAANLLRDGRGQAAQALLNREARKLEAQAGELGGSARLSQRASRLKALQGTFQSAISAPEEAGAAIKKAKADSYLVTK